MLANSTVRPRISTYALYSEEPSQNDPEFVHIEEIKSRARLFDWTIGMHTHPQMYQLVYVQEGNLRAHFDGQVIESAGPCIFTIPASVAHGFEFERDRTRGHVITLSRLLLADERLSGNTLVQEELMPSAQLIPLTDHAQDRNFIEQTIELLVNEYNSNEPGKQQLFECLILSLLIKLGRHLKTSHQERSEDHYESRYRHLCGLIEKHYREHQPCQFYADILCTTPIGLNRACRAVSGKSVVELIQDRLALEAQRLLIYSSAPVSLIAYELGFTDPAYFSRFFKRRVGASPSAFRENRHQGQN